MPTSSLLPRILCLVFLLCALPGCSAARSNAEEAPPSAPAALPEAWRPLAARLTSDGLYTPQVEQALLKLGPTPSQDPMGRKIRELYTSAFLKPKPDPGRQQTQPSRPKQPPVYRGVVTPANVALCKTYLHDNKKAFDAAEARFGVPREIAVALLFVETRLGAFLGKESAFLTLAGMAASTGPEYIPLYLAELPGADARQDWIRERMLQRSDRAYKELAAFIRHAAANRLDLLAVPGSIYGAIGLCQFMPSNLAPYAVDGDGDGVVDLFVPADAVASLSHYLHKHGWKSKAPRTARHAVLKSYNRLNIYANTILALADAVAAPDPGKAPAQRAGKK